MSVQILVADRNGRPVEGAKVLVSWGGSSSERSTDSGGIANLNCSAGRCNRISIDGKVVMEGGYYLKDGITRLSHPIK